MPLALLRLGLMPYEIWITAFLALKPKGIIKISVGWVRVAQSKYIWGQRDFAWPIKVFATLPKTPCYKCPARGQKPSSLSLGVKQRTQNRIIVISKQAPSHPFPDLPTILSPSAWFVYGLRKQLAFRIDSSYSYFKWSARSGGRKYCKTVLSQEQTQT